MDPGVDLSMDPGVYMSMGPGDVDLEESGHIVDTKVTQIFDSFLAFICILIFFFR